jgi:hypothetical protein
MNMDGQDVQDDFCDVRTEKSGIEHHMGRKPLARALAPYG